MKAGRLAAAFDSWQQRHRSVAIVTSTIRSFAVARGGDVAALIAYRSFLSLFPLLVALTTVADLVLASHPDLRDRLVGTAVSQVPLIGDQMLDSGVHGHVWTVILGLVVAIWAGQKAVVTLQRSLNDQWRIPKPEQPKAVQARLLSLLCLGVIGLGLIVTTALSALTLGGLPGSAVWGPVGAMVINSSVILAISKLLTPGRHHHGPGSVVTGVGITILQIVGSSLVDRFLVGASATYGTFASVIAITAWISLNAQLLVLGTNLNVVLSRQWYPFSLDTPFPT